MFPRSGKKSEKLGEGRGVKSQRGIEIQEKKVVLLISFLHGKLQVFKNHSSKVSGEGCCGRAI